MGGFFENKNERVVGAPIPDSRVDHSLTNNELPHLTIVNQRTLVWKRRQTSNEYSIILMTSILMLNF